MRAVLQRVRNAEVSTGGVVSGSIANGLLIYLGVQDADNEDISRRLAEKIRKLRIFADENHKMNLSVEDVGGQVLVVSQFTLYADLNKGNRPSWDKAGKPDHAQFLYKHFMKCLEDAGLTVRHGVFGSDMIVKYENMGPVTIIADSDEIIKRP